MHTGTNWHVMLRCRPPSLQMVAGRRCGMMRTDAKRHSEMDKSPVVLPGEDQDPLSWVRTARDLAETEIAELPRRRQQPKAEADEMAAESAESSASSTADSDAAGMEAEEMPGLAQQPVMPVPWVRKRPKTLKEIKKALKTRQGIQAVLDACEEIWPDWSANGCRKLDLRGAEYGAVRGPKPAEAAAALRMAADKSLRRGCSGSARLLQARDRRLLGLVEALGVVPPRPPPGGAAEPDPLQHGEAPAAPDTAAAAVTADSGMGGAAEAAAKQTVDVGALHAVQVTDAVWSLGVMGGPVLFEQEMEALLSGVNLEQEAWRPHLVADVLWAMALAHHWSPRLPEWDALLLRLGGFASTTARHAASVLWAFATLGHVPTALVQQVDAAGGWRFRHEAWLKPMPKGPRTVDLMGGKAVAAAAWSLAATEQTHTEAFRELWQEVGRRGAEGMGAEQKTLMQLHQVKLAVDLEGDGRQPEGEGAAGLLTLAADVWQHSIRPVHSRQESYHEGQIASTLVGLGRFHVKQDAMSGYSVDLSIPEARVAIEADGPSHFSRNSRHPGQLLGHSRMKHRHLGLLGWKVVSVPYYEWDELRGSAEKQAYLQDRLLAVAA